MTNLFPRKFHTALTLFALACGSAHAEGLIERFQTTTLGAGMHVIQAEVAGTDAERQQGLMYRKTMGDNSGMVFIFPYPTDSCMWMKNTKLALSVAFIDADGIITNIEDMEPDTTNSHCANKMVRYSLEMNKGWFAKKGIKAGDHIDHLPKLLK